MRLNRIGDNMLVKYSDGKLENILANDFLLERDLQKFFEVNMQEITGYKFLKTEFAVDEYRLDSVAYSEETNSFVIVEYKRGKNESLVDQGYSYLNKLLKRKADFVLMYNECTGESLGKSSFDWSQSKIVFVSPQFTQSQLDATSFKEMAFELYEVNRFEGELYSIKLINQNKIAWNDNSSQSKKVKPSAIISAVETELVVYDERYHFDTAKALESTIDLYNTVKDRILEIAPELVEVYTKKYIAFKYDTKHNVVSFWIKKDWIEVVLNLKLGEINDPYGISLDISNRKWSNAQYAVKLKADTNMDYLMDLIKQAYKINKV